MTKKNSVQETKNILNFFYEVGILSKTPRSGFYFLGSGEQSVAEHTNRVVYIGYALATLEKNVDVLKVMKMCLFHDLAEARVSDLNYVHQKYVKVDEKSVVDDLSVSLPFGEDIKEIIREYEERKTREAIVAKDADNLEWILSLKEQYDTGNTRAKSWMESSFKRLKTEGAKKLVSQIMKVDSNDWWDRQDGPASQVDRAKHKGEN